MHGNRSLQNNFLLDGVDNNTISTNVQELTTQVSRPSIDSIEEFKVVTSPYSAEYGRSPGAAISVTTKSGTNAFHGTVYDYYRNEKFDSNTYFNEDFRTERSLAPLPKPANDQNQFGGNLGGPIIKDKAFFFADYEGTRITRGVTRITRVPTLDERQGIFAGTRARPAHRPALPGQQDPGRAASTRWRPLDHRTCCREPNTPGRQQLLRGPTRSVTDDADRFLGRVDLRARARTTRSSRATSTPTASACMPGRVRRRRRRHRHARRSATRR